MDTSFQDGLRGVPDEFDADQPGNGLGLIPPTKTFVDLSLPGSMAVAIPAETLQDAKRQIAQRDLQDAAGEATYVAVAGPTKGDKTLAPTPSQSHSRYPRTVASPEEFYRLIKDDLVVVYYFAEWCPPCRVRLLGLLG